MRPGLGLLDRVVRRLARRRDAARLRARRAPVAAAADQAENRRGEEQRQPDDDERDQEDRAHPEDDQDDPKEHDEEKEKGTLHASSLPGTRARYALLDGERQRLALGFELARDVTEDLEHRLLGGRAVAAGQRRGEDV